MTLLLVLAVPAMAVSMYVVSGLIVRDIKDRHFNHGLEPDCSTARFAFMSWPCIIKGHNWEPYWVCGFIHWCRCSRCYRIDLTDRKGEDDE